MVNKLKAIKMDARERKVINENFEQVVPYEGATGPVDLSGNHLYVDLWEDLRFPVGQTKVGALGKPDYDYTENGLLFPQNDTGEVIYIVAQMPHSYKLGSPLGPHLHFIQTSALVPVFKMKYRWYDRGAEVSTFATVTSTGGTFPYTAGAIHQRLLFPEILPGATGLSSILDIQIWRDDNVVAGDVLVKEFDIHYQRDTLGSLTVAFK